MEKNPSKRISSSAAVKTGLTVLFLFSAVLTFLGVRGKNISESSGFSSPKSYSAIYHLANDADSIWKEAILPSLEELEEAQRQSVDRTAALLYSDQMAEEYSGEKPAVLYKTLLLSYQFSGPNLSSAQKKRIAALSKEEAQKLRLDLFQCIADETAPVPSLAEKNVSGLSGNERSAMLFQVFFTSAAAGNADFNSHVILLKKSVRGKDLQKKAAAMAAEGTVNFLMQGIISRSRTIILIGVLLMIDIVMAACMMAAESRWEFDIKWVLILLIIDFLLVFLMLPMVHMFASALFPDGKISLDTLRRLFTYPMNLEAVKNTMIASILTMIFGTLIAFPLAFLVGRTNLYGRKFFRTLFVVTYMVPPYVGAMAWLRLMNPNVGAINIVLRRLFGLSDMPGPLNVYTLPGIIWVLTTFYFPYAFITISRAMEKMDPTLEDASRISGASPMKTIFRINLPLMLPSLLAGALLVFISAASCYGIPSIIGKPGNVNMVTTRIIEYTALGQQGLKDATALSVFLMAVALLILMISDVVLARRQYITVSGKSVTPTIIDLRSMRMPLTIAVSLFALIVIGLPFMTIILTSFKTDVGKSVLAAGNFTLASWKMVFANNETIHSLKNSLVYGLIAATAGIVISIVMNYLQHRTSITGKSIPAFLITLGSGTPSVVIALGLIMTMRGTYGVNIYGTASIIVIAYMVKYLMMGMRTVSSSMSQVHASLEESSQISGAGWLTTMRRVTGPLIFPSIAAGWFLIFIPSFYELSMTTLLYSGSTKTIGFQLYEYWTFTSQTMSCAMATGILLFIAALNFILSRITGGKFSI